MKSGLAPFIMDSSNKGTRPPIKRRAAPSRGQKGEAMNATTTNAATISRAAIMRAAHAATRETVAAVRGIDYRATFAAALREEWDDARTAAALDAAPEAVEPGSAAAELAAMDGETIYARLLSMVGYCRRRDGSFRSPRTGAWLPPAFAWIKSQDDARAVAHDGYIRLYDLLERRPDSPLPTLLFRAVMRAAVAIQRAEQRNARAIRYEADTEDGDQGRAYIIDNAAPMARERAADPYHAAALADSVERVCNDDTDRAIIAALAFGYTHEEAAAMLGSVKRAAVTRRIQRMRERWNDAE